MKINFLLIAASLVVFVSCNNTSDTKTTTETSITDTSASSMPHTMDTAANASGLMKAMTSMMSNMKTVPITGDFDVDYANMMIAHHQGALDMAQVEISQGADADLKSLAQTILTKQSEEQEQLKDMLKNHKPHGMKHGEGELQQSTDAMGGKMMTMTMSGNVDKDFATMMASHHEHGVSMDKLQVEHGMNSKLKEMAKKSIASQQQEIARFQAWLAANP